MKRLLLLLGVLTTLVRSFVLPAAASPGLATNPRRGGASPALAANDRVTCEHFLRDLEFLGPCRMVVVGPGAILEAVGAFDSLRTSKGLATVSNGVFHKLPTFHNPLLLIVPQTPADDNSFECHVRLDKVRSAEFATKASEGKNKLLHIIRLKDEQQQTLLSAILAGENGGEVEDGAIEFWNSLRDRFGEKVQLLPPDAA